MNQNTIQITLQFKDDGTIAVVDQAKGKVKELNKTVDDSKGTLATAQEGWGLITMKVAAASAAFYAAKRLIYDTAVQIASATNDIQRQAAVLGMTTTELQKWQYAAKMSDVNAQEFAMGIKLLSANMEQAATGSDISSKYFTAMGVSVKTAGGHLRPLNEVMGDIMDKFSSWEDGPRKIAIAIQLFGRSGETMIPLLNKGRTGFQEFAAEAQKLGIILSPELVKKGSEAEDIFKRINAQLEAGKLAWAPYSLAVATGTNNFLEGLSKIKKWIEDNPTIWNFIAGAIPGGSALSVLTQAGQIKKTAEQLKSEAMMAWEPGPTALPKPQPPVVPSEEGLKFTQQQLEDTAKAWGVYADEVIANLETMNQFEIDKRTKAIEIEDQINKAIQDREGFRAYEIPTLEQENKILEKSLELEEERIRISAQEATKGRSEWVQQYAETPNTIADILKMESTWQEFGNTFSSVWSENVKGIVSGTKTIGDAFKNMATGMADAFISAVAKMITNWILFQNIQGKYNEGQGAIGWLGGAVKGLFSSSGSALTSGSSPGLSFLLAAEGGYLPGGFLPIQAFQGGGRVNRPTLGLIGEGGEDEWVIPESKMGRAGGSVINNYYITKIDATDPGSFQKLYGESVLSINRQSARVRGTMHKIMRNF